MTNVRKLTREKNSQQKEKARLSLYCNFFFSIFSFLPKPPCTDAGLATRYWSETPFCLARTCIWVCFQLETVFEPALEKMFILASSFSSMLFSLFAYFDLFNRPTPSLLMLRVWFSKHKFYSSCFIPSSKTYWYKPCGCRAERWWWLGHVSNTGQGLWKESCWGSNLNVLRNELWCLSCVTTHQWSSSTGKVCTVRTHWCPVLFLFLWLGKKMPSWNKPVAQMVYELKSQLPENYIWTLIYLNTYVYIFEYKTRSWFLMCLPTMPLI